MDQEHLLLVINETEPAEYLNRSLRAELAADVQLYGRRGIDGSVAEWTVLVLTSTQGLVAILNWILKWRDRTSVKKIRYGKFEIENPTDEDVAAFRRRLNKSDD